MTTKDIEDIINSNDDVYMAIDNLLTHICEDARLDPEDYDFTVKVVSSKEDDDNE